MDYPLCLLNACSLTEATADIDQWHKITEQLGTPEEAFFEKLQPTVGMFGKKELVPGNGCVGVFVSLGLFCCVGSYLL